MIEISHLKKSFGSKSVLRDVNLDIHHGETLVIIGQSGCGKSVLLKLIMGLLRADGGHILVDGEDVTRCSLTALYRTRQKFGMLFQGAALFDSMTVEENLAFAIREHSNLSETDIQQRVRTRLKLVGMPDVTHLKPAELSGGMKKRVALARALMLDPEFVLFDEPTTGLDPIMADVINEMIIDCSRELDITSIVVTHDMTSAYKVADRIAMMHDGRIVFDGTPEEIQNVKDAAVQQFIIGSAEGPIKVV